MMCLAVLEYFGKEPRVKKFFLRKVQLPVLCLKNHLRYGQQVDKSVLQPTNEHLKLKEGTIMSLI